MTVTREPGHAEEQRSGVHASVVVGKAGDLETAGTTRNSAGEHRVQSHQAEGIDGLITRAATHR